MKDAKGNEKIPGVSFDTKKLSYTAYCRMEGKHTVLLHTKNYDDAVKARQQWELENLGKLLYNPKAENPTPRFLKEPFTGWYFKGNSSCE